MEENGLDTGKPDRATPSTADHPPVVPVAVTVARRTIWPTIVGIIGIVLGTLGLLGGLSGMVISPLVSGMFRDMAQSNGALEPAPMNGGFNGFIGYMIGVSAIKFVFAAGLLGSAIGLVLRRRWCASAFRLWAIAAIGGAVLYSVMQVLMQRSMMSSFATMGPGATPPPVFSAMMEAMTVSMGVITFVWEAAFPIFVLIWFARGPIKEEVAQWS